MANLAVGLSKSVVVGAIAKVQSAIDEDTKLRQKAQRDLVFISLELEMMQSFVDDANKEMTNNLVRTWVKHIRQLAYDVEDCVENVVHLDEKPIFWRRLLPSFMAPVLPLDLAVKELEQLKCRVVDVNECYRRYSNINETSASKLAAVMQQQQQRQPPLPPGASNMLADARAATQKQHGVFADLTKLITNTKRNNHGLQVISVWEAGGDHETTPIIRRAYNHPEIPQNFTYRSWVKLMHPFSPHDFIRSMMAQFYTNSCHETMVGMHVLAKMETTQEQHFKEFEKIVTDERYLVVLEGLSSMVEWDAVRTFLPPTDKGSCIIVSTQQTEIASLCVGQLYQILELKKFSEEHSVSALFEASHGDVNKDKRPMGYHDDEEIKIIDGKISCLKVEATEWMKKNHPLVGRESEMNGLGKCLSMARVNSPPVMSVLGIAGVGKSALVKYFFYHRVLQTDDPFDHYYWVDISHPFNLRDLYLPLLSNFHSVQDPIEECHRLLKQYRCLIVIDDLHSKKEWDLIQTSLVTKYSRSVILVITSDERIARYCTNDDDLVFNVKALKVDEAVDLFKKQVSKRNILSRLNFQDVDLQDLVFKCGGIPKVIDAISGSLASMKDIHSLNRRFMHYLETDQKYYHLQDLFGWMQSMVLNPPAFLKPCIFYLSIFPQGRVIRRRRLVRRWIAEGYSRESMEMQAEENGEMFFSELLGLSIFQQVELADTGTVKDIRMVSYQVNGFIREYIMSREMEENLVFELGGKYAATTQSRGRHLIILESWERNQIVFEKIDFSRLRSLTVFGKWETFFIYKSMQLVRVLDLEDAYGVTDDDVRNMVKMLQRLKFLSLRGCREIYHLPSSLGDLRQLQTLDVRNTSIVRLPDNINKLQKLQYIRAVISSGLAESAAPVVSSCFPKLCGCQRVGVMVPGGIAKLTELHTIGVVNVTASGGTAFVKAVEKLTQLRKLGVSGINRRNSREFFSAISGHRYLESLSVQLDKDNEPCLDGISMPSVNIRSLKLYGLGDKLPHSIMNINKLTKVDLEMGTLQKDDGEFLANIPKLRILRLRVKQPNLYFYAMLYGIEEPTYKNVKILEIASRSSNLDVTFGLRTMKNLEVLKLDYSNGSSYQFSGLEHLSILKHVFLKGTDDKTLKAVQSQFAVHPMSPVVKLEPKNNLSDNEVRETAVKSS